MPVILFSLNSFYMVQELLQKQTFFNELITFFGDKNCKIAGFVPKCERIWQRKDNL